jgi:hypothetical protein
MLRSFAPLGSTLIECPAVDWSARTPPRLLAGCIMSALSLYAQTPPFQCNNVICSLLLDCCHRIIFSLNFVKDSFGKGLVNISTICSCMIDADCPFLYLFSKVMVLDVEMFSPWSHLGYIAISIAPDLSSQRLCNVSKVLHLVLVYLVALLLPLAIQLVTSPSGL